MSTLMLRGANPNDPKALGLCDRCQLPFVHSTLKRQMAYRGRSLVWTGWLVCDKHLDVPHPQDRYVLLPPDPQSIRNARPDQ